MGAPERGDNLPDEDFEALNAEGEEDDMDDEPDESYETEDEATAEEVCSRQALNMIPRTVARCQAAERRVLFKALRSLQSRHFGNRNSISSQFFRIALRDPGFPAPPQACMIRKWITTVARRCCIVSYLLSYCS